jgi:ElaB/YqjD/DUF883 family membrane-anchored ribosome-binding protein
MSGNSERILDDLQKVLVEIEAVVKATLGGAGERASDGAEKLHSGLNRAREGLAAFEHGLGRDFRKRAREADSYVHDNAWVAVGVAAAAAFLLGVFAARRE